MAIGALQNEGDLRRFIEAELERPGNRPAPAPPIALTKSGVPSDKDFPNPPGNGIFAFDREAGVLYARIDGEWVAV
jgi:hypothetical protein